MAENGVSWAAEEDEEALDAEDEAWLARIAAEELDEPAGPSESQANGTTDVIAESGHNATPLDASVPRRRAADAGALSIPVIDSNDTMVFAPLSWDTANSTAGASATAHHHKYSTNHGLSEPINAILNRIEHQVLQQNLAAYEGQSAATGSNGLKRTDTAFHEAQKPSQLWVHKYAPRMFSDLLSDGKANRQVVAWLKRWDGTVFNKPWKKHELSRSKESSSTSSSELPDPPLLLMSGPPGFGKTTLAHIAANHCGYRVIEVNASDERTDGALDSRIEAALETQSVTGDRRPACLVLDEIDGLASSADGKSAVDHIVKLASASAPKTANHTNKQHGTTDGDESNAYLDHGNDTDTGTADDPQETEPRFTSKRANKSKSKRRRKHLSRPIICICNELYAPALRALRQKAEIVRVDEPSRDALVNRLKHVANAEGVTTDGAALQTIVDKTACDARASLHALQYLSRKDGRVTRVSAQNTAAGQKDTRAQALDAVRTVLGRANSRAHQGHNWDSAMRVFQSAADSDTVHDGLHENLPNAKYGDVSVKRTASATMWLAIGDVYTTCARRNQQWALEQYRNITALGVRRNAQNTMYEPKLSYPKHCMESRRLQTSNENAIASWVHSCGGKTQRGLWNKQRAALETLPYLLDSVNPVLRGASPHLLSSADKYKLASVASLLKEHGLAFSGPSRAIDPPLEQISVLGEHKLPSKRYALSAPLREAATHEATIVAIGASEVQHEKPPDDQQKATTSHKHHQQPSKENQMANAVATTTDASGWKRKRSSSNDDVAQTTRVRFKHNEGVTNSVRRPVFLSHLTQFAD